MKDILGILAADAVTYFVAQCFGAPFHLRMQCITIANLLIAVGFMIAASRIMRNSNCFSSFLALRRQTHDTKQF